MTPKVIEVPDDFPLRSPGPPARNGRLRIDADFLVKLIGFVVSAIMLYSAINARVSVLEAGFQQMREDVREIKQDVKALRR